MHSSRLLSCKALSFLLLALAALPTALAAQSRVTLQPAQPVPRVKAAVDDRDRVVIAGHVPPVVRHAADAGRLPQTTAMNHLIMVLQPSVEQDHALATLLDQQLDRTSAVFHKWLTPEQFGARFGVHEADVAKVTGWLAQQGFKVEKVAKSKRFIQFSGTVRQVETAFRTEMHSFEINGHQRVSNNTDISVPAALRPVIGGVPTLNSFFKHADFVDAGTVAGARVQAAAALEGAAPPPPPALGKLYFADPYRGAFSSPDYTNGTTHFVGAGDFATIYNTTPLLTAGFDGTGISIGIIARTDINLSDVQIYRTMFGLKPNDPTFTVVGEDPGVVPGDDGESYLDAEVSGGAAPGAQINFITSRATLTTDGVDLSAMYAVDNNLTDIISESYGQCENNFSATAESFYTNLWGQAAAQGITVFLSSGDNGPAACDDSNSTFESFGYAVTGLGSTPFNVAVGGTLFADTAANWNATATTAPPFASALGYIPEVPWNEAKASGAVGAAGLWSGSGGISAYFPRPSWQHGFGVPASDPAYAGTGAFSSPASPFVPGPHRYLPDVAMAAAAQHDGTLYCGEGICQLTSTGALGNAGIVGGTSVAAPSMAGVQALIDHVNGGRQGMANYVYYTLADNQHTAGLNCASSSVSLDPTCAFRDITTGNTLICANSACTAANKIGWTAGAGYDLATGLGSPNAAQLANLWSTVTFRSSTTTLGATPTTGLTHGQSVAMTGTVAPGSGTGVPTGQVTFIQSTGALGDPPDPNTGGMLNPPPLATLDGSGNYSIPVTNLPAGTYSLVARYGGDATFAASTSAPVTLTVAPEAANVTVAPNAFNGTTCVETAQTTFTYGSYIWTDFTVAGASLQGVPTGTLAITDNGNPLTTATLNASGVAHVLSGAIPTTSCVSGYTFQDAAPLTVGTHALGASYSGDGSFDAATASPVTVTITPASVTGALTTSATTITSGGSVQLTLTTTAISGAGPGTLSPSGTATFTDTTTSTVLGTAAFTATTTGAARAVLTTTAITTAGANSITASWSASTNYSSGTASAPVTVTVAAGTATSVAVTSNTNPSVIGGRPTFTATMTPTTVTSGTVNFFDGGVLLGSGTVGAAHTATFRPAATVNLPAGVHSITAVYAGNATFASSVSPVFSQTFTQSATTIALTVKTNGTWHQTFAFSGVLGTTLAATPPSGTIQFLDGGSPIGSPQPMATVATAGGGFGLFQASFYTPLTAGTHTITATLADPNYTTPASNSQTITVAKANPTFSAVTGGGTFTYNGSPHALAGTATGANSESLPVTFSYSGTGATTYGPTAAAPTGAGTYTGTLSTAGDANNNSGNASPVALTINKANPAFSAVTGGGTFTYNGSPHALAATATGGGGESLTVTFSYTGTGATTYGPTAAAPAAAGTYLGTASTTGNANNNSGNASPVAITINKATPAFSAVSGGGTFTYNGTARPITATATGGAGESLTVTYVYSGTGTTTYGPTATAPSGAGTYAGTASTAGDTNNASANATPAAILINKANPTLAATGGSFGFDGNPHGGSGTATGGAGETLPVTLSYSGTGSTTYGPTATAPSGAGSYTVTASTVGDANNNSGSSTPASLSIGKATSSISATGGTFTYDGNPHGGTGSATGGTGETETVTFSYTGTGATTYGPTATAPTNAGTYQVVAHTDGDTNSAAADSTATAITINKANPVVTATGGSFAFDGNPHGGSGTATGGAGESLAVTFSYSGTGSTTYGPTPAAPSAAGSYAVTASTVGDANNNAGSSTPAALSIGKAASSVSATGGTFTYDGSPHGGGGSATGGTGETETTTFSYTGTGATTYGPTATAPANAGTYQVVAHTDGDANSAAADSKPAAITINQAVAAVAVTGFCTAFDGTPHTALGTATGVLSASLTGLDLAATTHTAPGTYTGDAWTFSNTNYVSQNGAVDDAIVGSAIAAAGHVDPGSPGNVATVPDSGTGATYAWTITGGAITGGSGTPSVTFTAGAGASVQLSVTVTTTTGCAKTGTLAIPEGAAIAQVPTLGSLGLLLLGILLAAAALAALRLRRV
jgi:hypothetical protein